MKQPLAKTKGVEPNDSCACTPTWIFHSQSSSGDSHVAATSPKAGAHAAEAIHLDPGNTQEHMFTMGPSLTSSRLGGQQYNQWTCPVQHTAGGSVLQFGPSIQIASPCTQEVCVITPQRPSQLSV